MSQSQTLRKHHRALARMADELQLAMQSPEPADGIQKAVHALSRMNGLLALHLALEDKVMVPRLQAQAVYAIVEAARRHTAEVGGFKEAFDAYRRKWLKPSAIDREWEPFAAETRAMLAALRDRMAREERDIYPLLDKSGF